MDNGPEFAGRALDACAYQVGVKLSFIRPGKPVENTHIESFNGKFHDECLNNHWLLSFSDSKERIDVWRTYYNDARPHSALKWQAPAEYARQHLADGQIANLNEPEISTSDPD